LGGDNGRINVLTRQNDWMGIVTMAENDPSEAVELERAADWRIKKFGENPGDAQSAAAAKLLQKLADDVRQLRGSPADIEYQAILNWLGEFDVMEDFAERAFDYREGDCGHLDWREAGSRVYSMRRMTSEPGPEATKLKLSGSVPPPSEIRS
jgi:hypothetical protein